MKISHGFEFAAFWLLAKVVQLMPAWLVDKVAVVLGKTAYHILTSRRRIAMDNLRRAFKDEKTEDEYKDIAKGAFVNFARTTLEFMRLPIIMKNGINKIISGDEERKFIDQAMQGDKGMVLITGHFGSWELFGGWLASLGYPTDFLVGQQHNLLVDKMLNDLRRSTGVGLIPVGVAARHVIKALKNRHQVAFISDHHSASGGVVVKLFDRPASTPKGAAMFSIQVGCPVVLGVLLRKKYNLHEPIVFEPIYPPDTGDKEKDIESITQQYTSLLESVIRKYPDQWMWTHRRWKLD